MKVHAKPPPIRADGACLVMRGLLVFLAVAATVVGIVLGLWWMGVELSLVPTLIAALLLTTILHLALNRPRWRT